MKHTHTNTYTNTQPYVLRYFQYKRKQRIFFPGYQQRETKQNQQAKKWLRKWRGLKWFKLCDIWFHGDSFNECQRPKAWKEQFFAQDAALWGLGSFRTRDLRSHCGQRVLQAQQGAFRSTVKLISSSLRVSVEMREDKGGRKALCRESVYRQWTYSFILYCTLKLLYPCSQSEKHYLLALTRGRSSGHGVFFILWKCMTGWHCQYLLVSTLSVPTCPEVKVNFNHHMTYKVIFQEGNGK